ncbi:MAG TPA: hypothetical protein VIT67_17075 [Povalibacter sp.]
MAGYSTKSLAGKLGIKPGSTVFAHASPQPYPQMIAPVPDGVVFSRGVKTAHISHLFFTQRLKLQAALEQARKEMPEDAALWISWPKRSSGVATDIIEDAIRELCLPLGLVDIKVCAVDDTWSGLKLVIRKEFRQREPQKTAKKSAKLRHESW